MEAVTTAWDSVDWDRLQARVEAEVQSLGQRQDDSEAHRKRLVEESNAYRDRTDKETRKVAVPLIKAFQSEFDGLLARSSAAEAALIDICSSIINLPDPKSLLKGAEAWKNDADKTQKAVEEREDLKRQLLKANSELEEFRGKDVKVRKLKDKLVKLESEQDSLIETAVSEAEKKIELEFDSRLAELVAEKDKMKEQNEILEKDLDNLESKNKEIQRKLEIAQMTVEQKEGLDNEQLSIALKDLSDAKNKIVFLEEKISQLEKEAQQVSESKKAGKIEDIAALGSVLVQKDETIQQLTDDLRQTKVDHSEQFAKWKADFSTLENKNKSLLNELDGMKAQLESKTDYDAIKNELRLLREIEFGASADANADSIERLGETVETLDRLLAEKNRRLQNENASLRVMNEGFKGDAVMTAIVSGSHYGIVDAIGKKVGFDEAHKYRQRNTEADLVSRPVVIKKKREEKEFRFDDPTVDVLTYLKKVKEKKNRERERAALTLPSRQITKSETYTITTTALSPTLPNMPVIKEEVRQEEDIKLSTNSSTKRFTSPTKVVETKTAEEQQAEQEVIIKMQNRIQENIQALNGRALNTTEIASHCKRLMIAYNIGQRLFAKLVMNQVVKSQGSLSELLSKPRHWNKLTDKGREAFRRIYGWMSDNEAIDMLCSLSPRRVWPADQNIEHPSAESLIDASEQNIIECKEEMIFEVASASPPEVDFGFLDLIVEPKSPIKPITFEPVISSPPPPPPPPPAPPSHSNGSGSAGSLRSSRWRHDDISKEKILSIFQSEMAKLEEQKTTVEKAVSGKIPSHARRFSNASSIPFESSSLSGKTRHSAVETVLKQRMAVGLQPLTQAQYDTYASLDTELLVKQIKEFLTVNSISQRQFGEFILGLSQGSVSDLLARPKTWAQLTQKGREPFIRMQLFMDDVETASCELNSDEKQPQITVCEGDSELAKTLASILNSVHPVEPVGETKVDIKLEPASEIDLIMQKEGGSNLNGLVKYIDISGEEILDTFEIVYRVKAVLTDHGVSPKTFGEEYLGCSSTTCADLMFRTKSFENSKPAEKVMYQRMKEFLSNPDAIETIVGKEPSKEPSRDRSEGLFRENSRSLKRKQSSDGDDYESGSKKPIQRTVITDYQKDTLRFVFVNEQHPTNELCDELALKLDMSVRTVQNWFHNHRTRSKAREKEGKIYSDALPNGVTVKTESWQDELQKMLDNAPALSKQWAPDYKDREDMPSALLGNQARSSADSPPTNNNSIPVFTFSTAANPVKKQSGGQLDKLVARMMQMAEGREAAAAKSK